MIKISTIKDVAKYTGLSIATISKYINGGNVREKNRVLIEEAIKVLDYKINEMARGLKTNETRTVGILIPSLVNIFFTSIVSSVENILIKEGYSTIICDYREDLELEKSKLEFLVNKNVDGVIMVSYGGGIEHIKELIKQNIPVVLLDRLVKDVDCDVVMADNLNASYNAVEELFTRNHKNIGIICGPKDMYTSSERLKGYQRVYNDYGYPFNSEYVCYGDYTIEGGYKSLEQLWQLETPPTAVYITNYEMTLGAIMAVNDMNLQVPKDLSIIGFDNIQLAKVIKPSLSVVVQPMQEMGEMAAKIMLKRLKKDYTDFPRVCRLKTEVIIKNSVERL